STCQASALRRTSFSACCASVTPIRTTSASAGSSGSGVAVAVLISNSRRGPRAPVPGCGRGLQGSILQHECGDALAVQPLRHFYALVIEPQNSQGAAWRNDDRCAGGTRGIRQEDSQRRIADV